MPSSSATYLRRVVVPDHRSLDTGTLDIILDGAGLSVEEFIALL